MESWFVVLSRRQWSDLIQGVGKACPQAGQKGPRCEAREKSTSGGILRQYVGATPMGAKMIPAPIERHYPKRLLWAGWWQMSLFQRSVIRNQKDWVRTVRLELKPARTAK